MSVRVVLLSLIATACGTSAGNGAPDAGQDAGQAGRAFSLIQAKLVGKVLAAGIEDAAKRYGPVTPDEPASEPTATSSDPVFASAAIDAECVALSGDATDVDGDSIPADATLTFDCSARRLGYTGSLTGTESVSDQQPNSVAWAFTADADLQASLTGPFGGSMVMDGQGTIIASQDSLAGPYLLDNALDVVTVITNVRGVESEITETIDWTVTYTPDFEWAPGGPLVVGNITADGAWDVSIQQVSAAATLATPTPLTVRRSCDTRITAGLVEASFEIGGQAASIQVEWTGCGQRRVTYH